MEPEYYVYKALPNCKYREVLRAAYTKSLRHLENLGTIRDTRKTLRIHQSTLSFAFE